MPGVALAQPILVDEQDQFLGILPHLEAQERLAVDTESNSLYAYRERVCLIQISTLDADYLIDPLKLDDLAPLGSILSDPAIEKVFHAAEYDLIGLRRDFGFRLATLFDTRVACRTLGRKRDGLGDLLLEEFLVHHDKRGQRANWGRRPLPPDLLDYARRDTRYLLPLRDRLAQAVQSAKRWDEVIEECERLTELEFRENGFDPHGFWSMAQANKLSPAETAVLQAIYRMRDKQARRLDRPLFKVLSDHAMVAIAQAQPTSLSELSLLPGVGPGTARQHGEAILAAIQAGRRLPSPVRPPAERIREDVLNRYHRLRRWRKRMAQERLVESDVILPREVMWEIARIGPRDAGSLERIMHPLRWRFEKYGEDILRQLRG